jgi:hypothetical protein
MDRSHTVATIELEGAGGGRGEAGVRVGEVSQKPIISKQKPVSKERSELARAQDPDIVRKAKAAAAGDSGNHFGFHAALLTAQKEGLGKVEAEAVADNAMRVETMTATNKMFAGLKEKAVGNVQALLTAEFD